MVEDDSAFSRLLVVALTQRGIEVLACSDGAEALQKLSAGGFDVILTDINMPGVDGIDFLRRVRKREDVPPIVTMTGGGMMDVETLDELATALGVVETLQKPFGLDDLEATLRRAVHG